LATTTGAPKWIRVRPSRIQFTKEEWVENNHSDVLLKTMSRKIAQTRFYTPPSPGCWLTCKPWHGCEQTVATMWKRVCVCVPPDLDQRCPSTRNPNNTGGRWELKQPCVDPSSETEKNPTGSWAGLALPLCCAKCASASGTRCKPTFGHHHEGTKVDTGPATSRGSNLQKKTCREHPYHIMYLSTAGEK
jgi:hypothetical protein